MAFFDDLETRSSDQRSIENADLLKDILNLAVNLDGYKAAFSSFDLSKFKSLENLPSLPVLRKSELTQKQVKGNLLGGYSAKKPFNFAHIFQSPGPIYEPGGISHDWWRIGRFLHALNIGNGDIVHNCFSYHLTPAGMIFESGARAVGAAVVPAGVGQTELQVRAASDIGSNVYAGTCLLYTSPSPRD